ncbi:MAG: cytochrome C biogenesis protein, partial [Verrucomicrobiota bacterium]
MKKIFQKWFPPFLMCALALWFFGKIQAPHDQDFAFTGFGELPVTANGRVQPMDSLARNALLQLREKQTLNLEPWKEWYEKPKIIPASEWLANVMLNPVVADNWPVFRIDNPDLIALLKLPEKNPAQRQDGKHYSWNQLQPALEAFSSENARIATNTAAENRTAYERAVVKMNQRIFLYAQLKNAVQPADAQDWPAELAAYEKMIPDAIAAAKAQQSGEKFDQQTFSQFAGFIQRFQFMSKLEPPLVLPPAENSRDWRRMGDALLDAPRGADIDAAMHDYAKMAGALAANQPNNFNSAVRDLRAKASPFIPSIKIFGFSKIFGHELAPKTLAEVFFNQMEPFYNAMVIYVIAGLLAIFSWFNLSETLRRSAVWLVGLAFVIHTTGLIYRMVLEGRPPVTNLYSSAIFIGWGAVILGLVLEKFYKNGI